MKATIDYTRFTPVDDLAQIEFTLSTGLPSPIVLERIAVQLNALVGELWANRRVVQRQGGNYVYVGMAGLAMTFLTLGDLVKELDKGDNHFVRHPLTDWTPDVCYANALACAETTLPNQEGQSRDKVHRLTFLEGKMGVIAIQIACHHRLARMCPGDSEEAAEHRNEVTSLGRQLVVLTEDAIENMVSRENELLYGKAGILFALHFVNALEGVGDALNLKDLIVKIISQIIESGLVQAREFRKTASDEHFEGSGVAIGFPTMYQWHEKEYLGAAHGYCGIIQSLLNVREYWSLAETNMQIVDGTIRAIVTHVMETIMTEARYTSGNVASSLPLDQRIDKLVHWCHGAPGFLLTLAAFLGQDRLTMKSKHIFNSSIQEMGSLVRERGCLRKLGLCHGLGGNGIALIRAYQITNDPKHIRRAAQYALYGYRNRVALSDNADRPLSLFEGAAGLAYLHMALLAPNTIGFPGYERVGNEIKLPQLRKESSKDLDRQPMSIL
eukprot:Gregarina_sp_Pseudo_9__5521@NODE_720_length_2314_cov_50_286593_g677_i0_p1_GENE_NODE_720_length_2314_cov_50_286593_g677_i0NODE_720_length_2314_cov_50_286593_g677_i0_p1_ORF_typecomplete_len497_score54_39LANC_like/PF05147_13/7_4e55_NODE_720_length_2314_cov_50_286593_g677_i07272217